MTCPDCGHDNIDGVDACDHCGQDLRSINIPTPGTGLQRAIMETPLRDLQPAIALTVTPGDSVSRAVKLMRDKRQGSVLVMEGRTQSESSPSATRSPVSLEGRTTPRH